jgi:hypothetical protein
MRLGWRKPWLNSGCFSARLFVGFRLSLHFGRRNLHGPQEEARHVIAEADNRRVAFFVMAPMRPLLLGAMWRLSVALPRLRSLALARLGSLAPPRRADFVIRRLIA